MLLEELQQLYNQVAGRNDHALTLKTKIGPEMEMTSLGLIALICAIEEKYEIEIPNSKMRKFKTVNDVVKFIRSEIGG